MIPFRFNIGGQLRPFPLRVLWGSVNRHFQSNHCRFSLQSTVTVIDWVGEVNPAVRSCEVIAGLRQAVRPVEYAHRISSIVQRAIGSMILTQQEP